MGEAVKHLRDKYCIQPVPFSFQGHHSIKLDNTAVPVNAFELLLQYFYACNVAFPTALAGLWVCGESSRD